MQVNLKNSEKIGTDVYGRNFSISEVAKYMMMKYNTMAANGPVGFNVCINCPILLGNHKYSLDALVEEFRERFASDAIIAFNSDYNIFVFDFT